MSSSVPPTSFSASGEDAITQAIEVVPDTTADQLSPQQFEEFYEIERTSQEIVKGDYQRIALQFPDELLHDSVPIYRRLKQRISELDSESESTSARELYVLADTSYGSCCVDEVAAQHVNADLVVHYGYACMTLTSRLPVIYVFGRKAIDIEDCVTEFLGAFKRDDPPQNGGADSNMPKETLLLKHDVAFTHAADGILQRLREELSNFSSPVTVIYNPVPSLTYPLRSSSSSAATKNIAASTDQLHQPVPSVENQKLVNPETSNTDTPQEFTTILYIGAESLGLTNLLMTNSTCDIYTYNPITRKALQESTTGRTNRLLMRRYVAVQKARDSDVFGILVGTLGVASYLPLISHIRRLLARKRKKSYTISVGKLNPAKLANFLEIECFVLVACPENSLIEDKEFLRPIVTPYELEVAMQEEQSWTGRYVLDFEKLLADAAKQEDKRDEFSKPSTTDGGEGRAPGGESEEEESDPDQPVFSLVTGKYRHAKRYGGKSETTHSIESSSLILRNQDDKLAKISTDSAAGQFLQQRTYQGLEVRLGMDAPSVLEQGRSGIARGYQDVIRM